MRQYLRLASRILHHGSQSDDRTGTGTFALFGSQLEFDLQQGFPLITTKKMFTKGIIEELLWMLRGETNVKSLQEKKVRIWDEWADENGDLGPIYGQQWRNWVGQDGKSIDQIKELIDGLRENPHGRRHIVSAWNPADLDKMKLPPCHCFFQFDLTGGVVNCKLYQRSADFFLGVPFNIASYAILTHLIAHCLGLPVGMFIHSFGNVHIYKNHVDQMSKQLVRFPRQLPYLHILGERHQYPWEYTADQIKIRGYVHHEAIAAPVSV